MKLRAVFSCGLVSAALAWSCGQTSSDNPPGEPSPPSSGAGGSGGSSTIDRGGTDDGGAPGTPELSCDGDACPALPRPTDPRGRYAVACCTSDERCGSGSDHVFGAACFERDQPGEPHGDCPAVDIFLYVDLGSYASVGDYFEGCCRADGLCGADTSRTVGAGCVELSALGAALDEGSIIENQGLGLTSLPCP